MAGYVFFAPRHKGVVSALRIEGNENFLHIETQNGLRLKRPLRSASPTFLPWVGTPSMRPVCSKPHPLSFTREAFHIPLPDEVLSFGAALCLLKGSSKPSIASPTAREIFVVFPQIIYTSLYQLIFL